jgi:hypothetical protein
MIEPKFEASVGMSRKWDAREAGREVAETAIQKLSRPPDFFLLFSTIHYEKYGGFQEFLNGVWDVLPKETPLVGGTVVGFINNYGCYTRGAVGLAMSSPNMNVVLGLSRNPKRNPKKAAKNCAQSVKKQNKKSDFFLEFISGPIIPTFPIVGKQTVIKSNVMGKVMKSALPILWKSNMGTDRADEVLDSLSRNIDCPLIGAVCLDDGKLLRNYQFFNNQVLKNAIILAGISGDINPELQTITPLVPRGNTITFSVKKDRRLVTKINGKEATTELCRLLGWDKKNIREVERFYSQAFYYPFCYHKEGKIHAVMLGLLLGRNVYFANKIESNTLELFGLTGKKIISDCRNIFSKKSKLIYGVICETYVETLGGEIYKIKEIIDKSADEYLLLFSGGESIIYDDMVPHHLYESMNVLRI